MQLLLLIVACAAVCGSTVRMDCHPEPGASQSNCEAKGCLWTPASQQDDPVEPWCYLKSGIGYKFHSQKGQEITLKKNEGPVSPWGKDFDEIKLAISNIGSTLNVKIYSDGRYNPPIDIPRKYINAIDSFEVETDNSSDPFAFSIVRSTSRRRIFDTSIGGLVFSDKFLQIATYLSSENMYGWGENIHKQIKHDFSKYLTWGMLARDEPPNSATLDTKNLYGVHPFYMIIEPDGLAHGVLILNSNAQEVTTTPGPALIYRTIGGNLDMYFFPGPKPEDVTQQYLAFVGKPFLPAYWALGYQLSRYGYKDFNEMVEVIENNRRLGIPLDVAVADIDYMERYKDFTLGQSWSQLPNYVNELHSQGMKLIIITDPAIQVDYVSFKRALDSEAKFIEWENYDQVMHSIQDQYPLAKNTKIMLGVVWPDRHVAFPDFFDQTNGTLSWWIDEFTRLRNKVQFDGIWIDMNEPANFGTNKEHPWYYDSPDHPNDLPLFCPMTGQSSDWDMPPYKTHSVYNYGEDAYLASKTLCMNAIQSSGRFYNLKNLYGWSESRATQKALYESTGKRGVIISRSTFPSSGRFAGHWLGDNTARWEDLQTSVIGVQEFNIFGIPYVGSDICGFIGASNEELCLRWHQLGAFHPFMRNHNNNNSPPQDPARWPSVAAATKKAALFRYKYLPYLFTLHFAASLYGGTVVRPVFYEFPYDSATHTLSYQFMWGKHLIVAPVVYQGAKSVLAYLPEETWYSMFDYKYGQQIEHGYQTLPAPITSLTPVLVRGGSILPRQTPNRTTTFSRTNPFELLIAPNSNGATGNLLWDDGESIVHSFQSHPYYHLTFSYNTSSEGAQLIIQSLHQGNFIIPTLDTLEIFNYTWYPDYTSFTLNGMKINVDVQKTSYSVFTKIFTISTSNMINLSRSSTQTLSWRHSSAMDMKVRGQKPMRKKNYE